MTRELNLLVEGLRYTEAPRWRDGALWFSDFFLHQVLRADLKGHLDVVATVPAKPSGIGWRPDGTLLLVSMHDCRLLSCVDGETATVANLSAYVPGPCNDMLVDYAGRAYIGNFGFDLYGHETPRATDLLCVMPDGQVRVVANDLMFPNGIVMTRDHRRLIVAETFAHRLSVFDVAEDGSLSGHRVFAELDEACGPDGICIDAEDGIWIADARGKRALRVVEGRGVVDVVSTGDAGCFACALGGDDGRTLFLCTAPGFTEAEGMRGEGRILYTRVEVPAADC
ncbi:SMP-30/gluconolactonase/LRE family protein [Paraburkholderia dinghuensis]|uniref:Gluconolactonase n=1 Tax=Paraburkholderia dinghuensis TaxID=2305225 RepID=A0A3N6NJE9_9BURK|nr:SMP-30/gluconolactonase/LRE family protein [Paraburkholderia dinghuensis]RQH08967.1 gluconolactonase [Paraburkholderia dinghuensis]